MMDRKEIKEDLITIKNEYGETLFGDVTYPVYIKKENPAVLLVHGFGVDRNESGLFDDLALELSSQGYLVFKFDFSGCGESEGDFSKTSLTKLKNELCLIIEHIKSRKDVDKLGILAQSFGTAVTIAFKPNVEAIVLMGSIAHPYKILKGIFSKNFNPEGISSIKRSNGETTRVGPQFWEDLKKYDLVATIKEISSHILFIHGEKDDKVPLSEMETLHLAANEWKERVVIKNADHGLSPERKHAYLLVVDWFDKYLKRKNSPTINT